MSFTTLVDVDTLARHLDNPNWIVFDCRHSLSEPELGSEVYGISHLPRARFAHLDRNLSGAKTGVNGRHPLPEPHEFANWLGRMGVSDSTQVIAYDNSNGTYGARLWWMLKWVGHCSVAVLDGGWAAWIAKDNLVTDVVSPLNPVTFNVVIDDHALVDANFVLNNIENKTHCIIDARASDRFRGKNEIIDPVSGHIPGALNRFFRDNLDHAGFFKSREQLREEWDLILAGGASSQIVHQCGSGVTACHNALAMEIAGLSGSKLFPGSWSEWVADSERPIVIG